MTVTIVHKHDMPKSDDDDNGTCCDERCKEVSAYLCPLLNKYYFLLHNVG